MTKRNTKKPNTVFCAGLVLLCLTLFSIHLTSGLYAKYTTKGFAQDSARVAKFDVQIVTGGTDSFITADVTKTDNEGNYYEFTIKNESEVTVSYELSVAYEDTDDAVGLTGSFSDGTTGNLAAGSQIEKTLTFAIDWDDFTAEKTGNAVVNLDLPFTITIKVEQVD